MKKRTARVTIETERLLVIRRFGSAVQLWCDLCDSEVTMLSVEQTAEITGISQRELFHKAEAGEIHFTETETGKMLFCVNSLSIQKRLASGA